jgi:hypothetical protein
MHATIIDQIKQNKNIRVNFYRTFDLHTLRTVIFFIATI